MHLFRRTLAMVLPAAAAGLILLALIPPSVSAEEVNTEGYSVPDLTGYHPIKTYFFDITSQIDGKETFIEVFDFPNSIKVRRFSVGDMIFAFTVENSTDGAGYVVVDRVGEGLFTFRYDINESFSVPRWLVVRMQRR
jgi:hypothetical protein